MPAGKTVAPGRRRSVKGPAAPPDPPEAVRAAHEAIAAAISNFFVSLAPLIAQLNAANSARDYREMPLEALWPFARRHAQDLRAYVGDHRAPVIDCYRAAAGVGQGGLVPVR
ncbi:MAG: hypothetical protein ACREND_10945 [Gemmatimonadaceae bacterium]